MSDFNDQMGRTSPAAFFLQPAGSSLTDAMPNSSSELPSELLPPLTSVEPSSSAKNIDLNRYRELLATRREMERERADRFAFQLIAEEEEEAKRKEGQAERGSRKKNKKKAAKGAAAQSTSSEAEAAAGQQEATEAAAAEVAEEAPAPTEAEVRQAKQR